MDGIIGSQLTTSGLTVYSIIRDATDQIWNGSSFEAYNQSHWSTYAVAMTEQTGSSYYSVSIPAAIPNSTYSFVVHSQAGGSPAPSDSSVDRGNLGGSGGGTSTLTTTDVLNQVIAGLNTIISSPNAGSVWGDVQSIYSKLPSGGISGFDQSLQTVNLGANQSGVTIGTVNTFGTSATNTIKSQIDQSVGSDAISELSGVPSSTPNLKQAVMFLFMALRNTRNSNVTTVQICNSSGTVIASATQSDNGVTYTKGNFS